MFVPHSELDLKKMFDELKINSLKILNNYQYIKFTFQNK